MSLYDYLMAIIIGIGVIAGGYFVWTWRPAVGSRWTWRTVDSGGWVWALLILYVWALLNMVLRDHSNDPPRTWFDVALGFFLAGGLTALLVVRALHWYKVRKQAFRA